MSLSSPGSDSASGQQGNAIVGAATPSIIRKERCATWVPDAVNQSLFRLGQCLIRPSSLWGRVEVEIPDEAGPEGTYRIAFIENWEGPNPAFASERSIEPSTNAKFSHFHAGDQPEGSGYNENTFDDLELYDWAAVNENAETLSACPTCGQVPLAQRVESTHASAPICTPHGQWVQRTRWVFEPFAAPECDTISSSPRAHSNGPSTITDNCDSQGKLNTLTASDMTHDFGTQGSASGHPAHQATHHRVRNLRLSD